MSHPSAPGPPPSVERSPDDRLDSWKEIAAYLKRDVTTVQRWEKKEGMPVHRHVHDKMGSVFAFRSDLDAWARSRNVGALGEGSQNETQSDSEVRTQHQPAIVELEDGKSSRRKLGIWLTAAIAAAVGAGLTVWQIQQRAHSAKNPLAEARVVRLTDFNGTEEAAAISRDGRFVAFLSDRDGRMDVWITQVGTGQFYNLTRDIDRELVNPSVRTLGFSVDGTLVTFWARRPASSPTDISIWAAPVLGGQPRPYLDGVAEFDWSSDGGRLVYHTPGRGDPMFVRDSGQKRDAREIFTAPWGLHSHFPIWSPDQAFIYFVYGSVPDRMDVWRIGANGGTPERITNHDSLVSHPVFRDARTLLYLARDREGSGPWMYTVDVKRRVSQRASFGNDRYTSLAASADGLRLVASLAGPKGTLWRLPINGNRADMSGARRIPLRTGSGSFPRIGPDYILYLSAEEASDSIWKLQGDQGTKLFSAPDTRIIGAPAIAPDGRRIAFSTRQGGKTPLFIANADGTETRVVTTALELHGAPTWLPDGKSLMVAVVSGGFPRLVKVPLDGGATSRFVEEYSVDPVWSPQGDVVVFSGSDIGTTFPLNAVTAERNPYPLPKLTLTRGARRVAFMPGRRALVIMRGDIRHKNLWLIDLETGAEHQLTDLAPDFAMRDFDISSDGRELILEQIEEHSDIVMLELPKR
jgi:Tol biopolymer transport system component